MAYGSDALANTLETALTVGKSFNLPTIDFNGDEYQLPETSGPIYDPVDPLSVEDLTTGTINGNGVFDKLMNATSVHLRREYDQNRITGQDYTKAYIASIQGSMSTAVQFLLGKDQAYWQAILTQAQAQAAQVALITARVSLLTAKLQAYLAQYQAYTAEAEYALTKLKLATEDANYGNSLVQHDLLLAQKTLINEQTEVQRAQTLDNRSDGAVVKGNVGKQKDLITQQITSYQRDAEVKAAKLFTDAWITQKTIDEGLVAPTAFTNASLDAVLTVVKDNIGFNG